MHNLQKITSQAATRGVDGKRGKGRQNALGIGTWPHSVLYPGDQRQDDGIRWPLHERRCSDPATFAGLGRVLLMGEATIVRGSSSGQGVLSL